MQTTAKLFYRLKIDTPVLIILKDIRTIIFKNSILPYLQSNLHNDLIYFNYFLNYSLNNPRIDKFLPLIVKTK